MKFSLGELNMLSDSLDRFSKKDMPLRLSWRISKLYLSSIEMRKKIESERLNLIQKYGEKINEKDWKVKPENIEIFRREFMDFLKEEIEIDFTPIKLSEIQDIRISATDLLKLGKILIEETNKQEK